MNEVSAEKYFEEIQKGLESELRVKFGSEFVENLKNSPEAAILEALIMNGECYVDINKETGQTHVGLYPFAEKVIAKLKNRIKKEQK